LLFNHQRRYLNKKDAKKEKNLFNQAMEKTSRDVKYYVST